MAVDPDLVASLRPERLPPDLATFGASDLLAILSLSLLAGLALAFLARAFTRRRVRPVEVVRRQIAAAQPLPNDQRLLRQAEALDALRAHLNASSEGRKMRPRSEADLARADLLAAKIGAQLYTSSPQADFAAIDEELLELAGKAR